MHRKNSTYFGVKLYKAAYKFSLKLTLFCTEFLSRCAEVYKTLTQEPHTPRETVVVPTSDPSPKRQVLILLENAS